MTDDLRPRGTVDLPPSFPQSDYTPFGYLDNPYHSAVINRSGAVRSVPPLGFGFWCRALPWPYGDGALRRVNYLSFLHLSVNVDGVSFHTAQDFGKHEVALVSRYHTKTMMSYDWEFRGVWFSIRYYLQGEHCLVCLLDVENRSESDKTITVHATNVYGWPQARWWGSDGFVGGHNGDVDAGVSKIWAYGDVFLIGADRPSVAHKATVSEDQWNRWIAQNDLSSNEGASDRWHEPMHTIQSYRLDLTAGSSDSMTICLTRGVNESFAVRDHRQALKTAAGSLTRQLAADEDFYRNTPLLTGDWPRAWKHAWIYDWETLRMNIRPPVGIYKHPWDGMQFFTPRQVLGETMLDTMCLSYADAELAKEVICGTFANAPEPNVPCSREDGSVNMISAGGHECGTAPIWGFPFHVIHSIYLRDRDDNWIRDLYPHLKAFIEWWLQNRTDKDGWFFTACSWESGQDASKRFALAGEHAAAVADMVRTVDIEAAMAEAMKHMALFAQIARKPGDSEHWHRMADKRIETTRAMFVDGWFRDFDSRTNAPIIMEDYVDIMMLTPVTVGVATQEQVETIRPKFQYFKDNPAYWLEWPSFMFPFAEAAWNVGEREFIAQVIADTGDRIYTRLDERELQPVGDADTGLPPQYNYRIPGVSDEFWPLEPDNPGGCENYGWGATLPMHVIRNIIGFREVGALERDQFVLAPAIPASMAHPGRTYGITNLLFRGARSEVTYRVMEGGRLAAELTCRSRGAKSVTVTDEEGRDVARSEVAARHLTLEFSAVNGALYTVTIEPPCAAGTGAR